MCGKMKKKLGLGSFQMCTSIILCILTCQTYYYWDGEGALFVIFNVLKCVQLQTRGVIEKLKTDLY